jgi:hypothetical protein
MHWFVHMSHFYLIMWPILVLPRVEQLFHHKSSLLHQTINVYCIKTQELKTESYQKSWSACIAHSDYCTPPITVSCILQIFFHSFLSSSSVHPLDRQGQQNFSIQQQVVPEAFSSMSLLWWSFSGYQHSSKNFIAAFLGGGLALGDTEDLANNVSTSHWLLPISNRFCLHSFHNFLWNSINKTLGYR